MKRKMVVIFLINILFLACVDITVCAKEKSDKSLDLYAQSAVLMDADSGRILFGKNENAILPMASTTKIMTCIIALEHMKDNQVCVVSELAQKQPKVHLGVKQGEKYYLKDLLYSLMLESHNDSAVIIAEEIGGSVKGFAELMNQKAREIGCINTYFITPNGLDDKDGEGSHSTTALELSKIMRYCIQESPKKEEFLEITRCREYRFKDLDNYKNYYCTNHNAFLTMMEGALSGKTGFTNAAGYCYVGALRQDKRTFIVSLLACGWPNNKTYKWKDTRKLMEYALDEYTYQNIWKDIEIEKIRVIDGMSPNDIYMNEVYIQPCADTDNTELVLLLSDKDTVEIKLLLEKSLEAPVYKQQKVGEIIYLINGECIKKIDVISNQRIVVRNIKAFFKHLIDELLLQHISDG